MQNRLPVRGGGKGMVFGGGIAPDLNAPGVVTDLTAPKIFTAPPYFETPENYRKMFLYVNYPLL